MSEQLYTMQQIADLAGVSRTTVFRYVQNADVQPYIQTNNRKQFNEQQKNDILSVIAPGKTAAADPDSKESSAASSDLDHSIIELLQAQLETKDEQIAALQKALDQQQQLQLKVQNELETARQQLAIETEQKEKTKKGFFARLFSN